MTALAYIEHLLDTEWTPSVEGRAVDVPKPGIYRRSAENLRRVSLDQEDILFIGTGGDRLVEPQSVGWTEEHIMARINIDARTTGEAGSVGGWERLWGHRGEGDLGANEAEAYGGLMGEIKRIMETVRRRDEEYDIVNVVEQFDLSEEMGGQVWRGTTTVELEQRARVIDPPGGD